MKTFKTIKNVMTVIFVIVGLLLAITETEDGGASVLNIIGGVMMLVGGIYCTFDDEK